jgi:hypothetical protein
LQVVAELMHLDQELYGMKNDPINMALRRYAGMALTNLTFGDVVNKVMYHEKSIKTTERDTYLSQLLRIFFYSR